MKVDPTCFLASSTSDASSKYSGRMPTSTSSRPATFSARAASSSIGPNGVSSLFPATVAGRKFIGGDPMNPATNRLTGCS